MPRELIQISNRFRKFIFPGVAVTYFLAAELSHALSFPGHFASFWPAAGIALAAYFYVGTNNWWQVLLGTLAANLASDILFHDKTVLVSLGFWFGNTCEALTATMLLRWLCQDRQLLWTARNVIGFVALPCLLGSAISASVGAGVVSASFGVNYLDTWLVWWSGDFIGMLVVFPVFWMIAETISPKAEVSLSESLNSVAKIVELLLLFLLLYATTKYIFGMQNERLAYAVYPVLLALSVRFSLVGATCGLLVLAVVIVANSAAGVGLFGEIEDLTRRAAVVQVFQLITSMTFLTFAALIRERVSVEKSREQAIRKLDSATIGGNVGLWDWEITSDRVEWSDQAHHQLGVPLGSLTKFEDWTKRIHPDDVKISTDEVAASMESESGAYESTFRLLHADGHYRWILSRGKVDFDSDGTPVRMSGSHTDITELKSTRDQLESYLRLIGTTDGSWNWDLETDQVEYSPRFWELLGYSMESPSVPSPVASFKDLIHPDDRSQWWQVMSDHLESNVPFENEFRLRMKDDSYRWFRGRGRALHDENGRVLRMAGSIDDVTARKQAELELNKTNEDLEQFAYVASHDLQEPLRAVIGFCQLLKKNFDDALDDQGRGYLRHIVEGSQRMKRLIDDLLEFSRVGKGLIETEKTDLNLVASKAVDSLSVLIEETHADIQIGDLPTVQGNSSLLSQLFHNLIGNGIKFQRPGQSPAIEVTGDVTGNQADIHFSDNGIGIAAEHQDQVFTMFERLHHRSEFSGTGIGLAICKRIVERHGGSIRVESEKDRGATFIVSLPIKQQAIAD